MSSESAETWVERSIASAILSRRGDRRARQQGAAAEMERRKAQAQLSKHSSGPGAVVRATQTVSHYSGPLPHPDVLQGFENVVPGAAARIIQLMETEGEHRRKQEIDDFALGKHVVEEQFKLQRRGQFLAFGIALVGFGVGGYAIHLHEAAAAATICGGTLASMVIAFLRGTRTARKLLQPTEGEKNSGAR